MLKRKKFKVKCDFVDEFGDKGVVKFECEYWFNLTKERFANFLKKQIIKGAYEEQSVVIKEITNLKVQRID